MLADDVVLFSDGLDAASNNHNHVTRWANMFDMTFGVPKCGVMVMAKDSAEHKLLAEELEGSAGLRTIQGQVIPIVREYEYLGIRIHDSLSLAVIVADREAKGTRAMYALLPFLRNLDIPLCTRVDVLRAVVLPSLLYGAELWGDRPLVPGKARR